MRNFVQQVTLTGRVVDVDTNGACFGLRCRSGDVFYCYADSAETRYFLVKNLGEQVDNRFNSNNGFAETVLERSARLASLLTVDRLVTIEGSLHLNAGNRRVDVRTVHLLYVDNTTDVPVEQEQKRRPMVFETNNWWVNQIKSLGDRWIFAQFGHSDDYDFANYRTYLDMYFKSKNDLQECATLSRLIYGFCAAYMLTGCERYLRAARNGIKYQQEHFRVYKDQYCFWGHGKNANSYQTIFASINGDDNGTIALYEQIYAIAGMTLYYRITLDEQILDDIRRTVQAFNQFFRDTTEQRGYFSHISPEDFDYNNPRLGNNQAKKNWNSVGDHIPAYLINLLIVIEPLAQLRKSDLVLNEFLQQCQELLLETSSLIVEKFPDQNKKIPFVNERFDANWTPDQKYSWQQNRGIVGHNLKISWNLIRVANYYDSKKIHQEKSLKMRQLAERLAQAMVDANGIDLFRGGCFDALERVPKNDQGMEFSWASTKDFWQQEQAILAYLILYGKTRDQKYLELAEEMSAFWNIKFLDRDNGGVFFRTDVNGTPIVEGAYGDKGGHAISGYHAFELCFLAHIYTCAYVSGEQLTLHLKPCISDKQQVLNVLPDYLPLQDSEIKYTLSSVTINGRVRELTSAEKKGFYVVIEPKESGANVVVSLQCDVPFVKVEEPKIPVVAKVGLIVEKHYDEEEVRVFREAFKNTGYQLEFITNLWGQKQAIYTGNDFCDPLRVTVDFKDVNVADYAGFILVGGYAMDRLRYEVNPQKGQANESPAVKFISNILNNTKLKVGTICHSAWLLSVDKSLLQDKELTCAHNCIYDIQNAGGLVQYLPNGGTVDLHVHGNLISGKHPQVSREFAGKFIEELNKGYRQGVSGV